MKWQLTQVPNRLAQSDVAAGLCQHWRTARRTRVVAWGMIPSDAHGVRCSPARSTELVDPLAPETPRRQSLPLTLAPSGDKGAGECRVNEIGRTGSSSTPRTEGAIIEPTRRNVNPDAYGKAPFGHGDHLSRITGHVAFLIRSRQRRHTPPYPVQLLGPAV